MALAGLISKHGARACSIAALVGALLLPAVAASKVAAAGTPDLAARLHCDARTDDPAQHPAFDGAVSFQVAETKLTAVRRTRKGASEDYLGILGPEMTMIVAEGGLPGAHWHAVFSGTPHAPQLTGRRVFETGAERSCSLSLEAANR